MSANIYEWLETQDMHEKVALECGALDFTDTQRLSTYFSRVLAFEANPDKRPPSNLAANVVVELQALSTFTGTLQFFVDQNPEGNAGASSVLPSNPFYLKDYVKKEEAQIVPCITMKEALQKHGLPCAHFMWLDMEGYELDFLRGTDLSDVEFIYTEVNFQRFRKGGCVFQDIVTFLESRGFHVVHKWTRDETWNGDVLFAKH